MIMDCIAPGTIATEDLVAYADGEADPTVEAHVRRCAACAAVAGGYARVESRLVGMLYRFDCPDAMVLGDYELGRLAPAARTAAAAHVAGCAPCGAELAQLRDFLRIDLPTPAAGGLGRVRRAVAALLAPAGGRAAAGLRGAEDDIRTYTVDGLAITIEVEWAEWRHRGTITGLVSPTDERYPLAEWAVGLYDAGELLVTSTTVDSVGTFSFEAVATGTYRVGLAQDDRVVSIEGIHVGPGGAV